jgi:hypothetical protein
MDEAENWHWTDAPWRETLGGMSLNITLHIYGTDVTRVGSSVRRCYDLPAER